MKMRRTPPFQGFSRGIPIVGERATAPLPGRYFYEVPCLIQWPGQPLEAESFEFGFAGPMEGVRFKTVPESVREALMAREHGKEGAPRVVALAPVFLGFVPQEEVDRKAAADAAMENVR